jgi:mycoredoxin
MGDHDRNNPSLTLYGTWWCFPCRIVKAELEKAGIPYRYIDLDKDGEAAETVVKITGGYRSVPTLVFPDGSILVEPGTEELKAKLTELTS